MALTKITDNLNVHQSLADDPALTTAQLKTAWDSAPNLLKTYNNDTLTVELDTLIGARVTTASIVNDLTTGGATVPLSAEQGKTLKTAVDLKIPISSIVNNLTSGGATVPLSAEQGKTLKTLADTKNKAITSGTAAPTGGSSGDIYIQYV